MVAPMRLHVRRWLRAGAQARHGERIVPELALAHQMIWIALVDVRDDARDPQEHRDHSGRQQDGDESAGLNYAANIHGSSV